MRRALVAATLSCLFALPAAAQNPSSYSQLLSCPNVRVARNDDAPFDKEILPGISMRAKRLDNGGTAAQHVAYIPSLDVGISSYLELDLDSEFHWAMWRSRIHGFIRGTILIDDHADGSVEHAYKIDLPFSERNRVFEEFAVPLLREARLGQAPLEELYVVAGTQSPYVVPIAVEPALQQRHVQYVSDLRRLLTCPAAPLVALGK